MTLQFYNSLLKFVNTVITLYSTLGEEAIKHGLIETDVNVIFTSAENVSKFKVTNHFN